MKKFIFLVIALLSLAVFTQAQSGTTVTFPANGTTATYTGIAADTLNTTSAPTKYWQFLVNKNQLYYYVATVRFDQWTATSRTVGGHCILTISGSNDGSNWVVMDTTLFHPTATYMGKTITAASDVSTGVLWKYLRFSATSSDANKSEILKSIQVKIGLRY